ncbi:MAG: hypothetical protein HFJ24_06250, partial [Clostridia bacterium]|nr:hypothetical protein [Clostridia bacterium]
MDIEASIDRLLQQLKKHGIESTKEFRRDIKSLVTSDLENFTKVFFKDFIRKDFENYNRFEKLRNLTHKQKKRLKGNILRRYEYRNTSNLRCIFIIHNDNNKSIPIILCAFNENGDKKKGKQSYNKNIDRAI